MNVMQRSWAVFAVIVGLTGCQGSDAPSEDLSGAATPAEGAELAEDRMPDRRHLVETVALSTELESLGGIGGVSVDQAGNVILANFDQYVWRISPEGEVEVVADDFGESSGNTVLRSGTVLQADFENHSILRLESDAGKTDVFSEAGLAGPVGLVEAPGGDIYVANFTGGYIARVESGGGSATLFASHPRMTSPNSIVHAESGTFYVADLRSPTLFAVSGEGVVTEFVTLPGRANGHLTIADGALYVTQLMDHRVMRVEFDGTFTVAAGTGKRGFDDGARGPVTVSYPNGIAADPSGQVVFFNNHRGVMRSGERGDIVLRRLVIVP